MVKLVRQPYLFFVDFKANIVGLENASVSGVAYALRTTSERAEPGEFRQVSETLPKYGGGWNPRGFRGGVMTGSVIGLLPVIEAYSKRRIWESDIGQIIELGCFNYGPDHGKPAKYVIRPCCADQMPARLWGRHQDQEKRRWVHAPRNLNEARRLCFAARNQPKPNRVYFGKGTTYVSPPENAVARIGSGMSSTLVFLDKFAQPISAYLSYGDGGMGRYVKAIQIPEKLNWDELFPLGKSWSDVVFGVTG